MLESMNILGTGGGKAMNVTVTPNALDQVPSSRVEFTIDYADVPLGIELFWTVGGSVTEDLVEPGGLSGSFVTSAESGTEVIDVQTLLNETLDATVTLVLEVRILSLTGNVISESAPVTIVYSSHPTGQVRFLTPGIHEWVVPDFVQYINAVCVGGGAGSPKGLSTKGGDGGALRFRNRIAVVPGETLTIEVGAGGAHSTIYTDQLGGDSAVRRNADDLVVGGGGGRTTSSQITYTYVPATGSGNSREPHRWDAPSQGPWIAGGDGGKGAPGLENNPGGGGGAGGYLGDGGDGSNDTFFRTWYKRNLSGKILATYRGGWPAFADSGGAGGGAYYYIAGNDSHHATPGGGVGLLGRGADGRGGYRDNAMEGGRGGSGGLDGNWTATGLYGGGGRGASSMTSPFPGAVTGGNGAVRLMWGVDRAFPNTNTGDL